MSRLKAVELQGVWAGLTLSWDENFQFDEKIFAKNVKNATASGAAGLYTTGSTGEFYALEFDEFQRMVDIVSEICGKANMPLQIGCCSEYTAKTIKMLEYASSKKEVGAVQLVIPYWMKLDDREILQFFKDIFNACPDMPLVYYNIPRAKRFLHGNDYLEILKVCPTLIGVKYTYAGTNFAALQSDMMLTPDLSYFVSENLLVSSMMIGAQGSYSSLVSTNPNYTIAMYEKAKEGLWKEAIKMQQHISTFFNDSFEFINNRNEVIIDPVFDKGLAIAAGCVIGHQRCRAPYIGWSDETIIALRTWLEENYPEFIFPKQD